MKNIAFVAARMSSIRLPEKVLKPLAGKPALEHVLANLQNCSNLTL
jgi:spore coat polysaccharide biosynthesis protein SpsF (cytidylyltransferase family)